MKKYMKILEKTELFSGIREEEIRSILGCLSASPRDFQKGDLIFCIGDHITSIALLLEGCVHIQKEDYWGNLSILNKILPGEIFGEAYAMPGSGAMPNNALAVTPCTLLFLDVRHVLTVCTSACRFHTLLIQNLFSAVSAKNRTLTQKLGHMSQRTTREKLLSYLSEQSAKEDSSSFDIPFNRQQLADFLSVDRSAMSHELCKMRDEGMLDFHKNHFILERV
ncbi:MAG: Crp/Fnr family transcriptional regulator [Lachnospiraceae bacterium]|nr:Crp/Fnr family transcriptional regulator [Lachnospiraceae bacterium]MCI9546358.1 Crp/Fnr family transcriptional regulator [Lachnospiraceae bacterium]